MSKPKQFCSICQLPLDPTEYGKNGAYPVNSGMCCDRCLERVVEPARANIRRAGEEEKRGFRKQERHYY